jgi:hypothetical protein
MNRLNWQWEHLPFESGEVCCFKASLLFVDSLVEIFSAVLQLQPLIVAKKHVVRDPEKLVDFLVAHKVTRLTMVPSLLRNVLLYLTVSLRAPELSALKLWISNSETLRYGLAKTFFEVFNHQVLYNLYGSTESMADITFERFADMNDVEAKRSGDSLSVGKPMHNSSLYILDDDLQIVPQGEIGQIALSGYNTAEGYWRSLGGENFFIVNPFEALDGYPKLYLSGDFGRVVNGRVSCEGRRDFQVKIRGQRVNTLEIDKVICGSALVTWSHVLCHQFNEASKVIVAYYKIERNISHELAESDIKMRCQQSLPCYMHPKLVCVSDIPLQSHSGKIDSVALRKLYEKAFNRQSSQELAVVDEKSRKIINILALNLNLPTQAVCLRKSFFELGGNSVNMVSSLVQLQQHNLHIAIEDFSEAKNIQALVDCTSESMKEMPRRVAHSSRYQLIPLTKLPESKDIIHIFTESFVNKEPLDVLLGVTSEEFHMFATNLYNAALQNALSLLVVDNTSGKIVAGDFLFNCGEINVEHHQSMAPILCLMKEFKDPIKQRLREEEKLDRLMYNYCLCVDKDLQHDDQVRLCHMMEEKVLQVAEENGFAGILTNNTNPVTQVRIVETKCNEDCQPSLLIPYIFQDICEHFFGYQVLSSFRVRDFVYSGRTVFSHAPEDYYIKMMIRFIP